MLSDYAAERESENITRLDLECFEEGEDMFSHSSHCCRYFAGGASHTRILEENDIVVRSQRIRHVRIPIVERTSEVLQEEQRVFRLLTETPVRVLFFWGLEKLCRRCDNAARHIYLSLLAGFCASGIKTTSKARCIDARQPIIGWGSPV
jgi:hypothetical protein